MTRDLRIWAYCTVPARRSVAEATGIEPLTSPPMTAVEFEPGWMEGHDLLYFRLHGLNEATLWFGEGRDGNHCLALTDSQIKQADLDGAVAVIGNCYGARSPMVKALYQAGASAVIAGSGENYAAGQRVIGADKLAREVIDGLRRGRSVTRALYIARLKLFMTVWRAADRDALEFRVIERRKT
jgi:hypothetical protein